MSRESLDAVRQALDALNRGDVRTFAACLHPAVEWEESADAFPGLKGIYHGREEVQKWAEQAVAEFWNDLHMEVEELTEASGGRVLLGILITAQGAASGVRTERRAWQVFWVVDGEIAKRHGPYWSRGQALETAGLQQ
jgi:ketosteroid isomerase-like protein